MPQAELSLRVRYGETDRMGFVYYAAYLPWMVECARRLFPVQPHPRAFSVRYENSCGYDDLVKVTAQSDSPGMAQVQIAKDDLVAVRGELYYAPLSQPLDSPELKRGGNWRTPITVRAHETQPWGIPAVTALTWFEASRNEHMRAVGLTYAECECRNIWLPVVQAWAELKGVVGASEGITVESIAIRNGVRVGFANRIVNGRGEELCVGGTLHVCITPAGKVLKPMSELVERLRIMS
jgi:acyl-CoA thioesterase FadM